MGHAVGHTPRSDSAKPSLTCTIRLLVQRQRPARNPHEPPTRRHGWLSSSLRAPSLIHCEATACEVGAV